MKITKKFIISTMTLSILIATIIIKPQTSKASSETYDAWGFFEWVKEKYPEQREDAQKAIDILNQYPKGYRKGSVNDASSIKNMKESIKLIKEGNELKLNDSNITKRITPESWVISHQAMAIAISNASNSSTSKIGHLKHFNVYENLAWGYKDPYKGWYYE